MPTTIPSALHLLLLAIFMSFHETLIIPASCCILTEKAALLSLKHGLKDPSHRLSSWAGEEDDCCNWRGVSCSNRTGHVVVLNLRSLDDGGKLGGVISRSLLDLTRLRSLDLSMNNFEGAPIPEFIGSLERLRYLNLSGASFGGRIPPQLGNLSRLIYLDLKEDLDFGAYPDESSRNDLRWIPGLSSLQHLNLEGIDLSGSSSHWLESVSELHSLSELHLSGCGLSLLPRSFPRRPSNLPSSLSVLVLSNNGFNSTIPPWIFRMKNLAHLDLSFSALRGTIFDAFPNGTSLDELKMTDGGLCSLKNLILSENKLEGEVTELIHVLSSCRNPSLERLNLGFNQLAGVLPNSIGNLRNLRSLILWENELVGSIPKTIGNLSNLRELYLLNNRMGGAIPETLGQLHELVVMDVSENSWGGVVTESHFSNLTKLNDLSIAKSTSPALKLVMNISSDWIPPFKLQYLNLRSCRVGPKFPVWLRNQRELWALIIRDAQISDAVPDWFLKLDLELDELDLSYNQLTGRVPNSFRFTPQSSVYLQKNNFSGSVPLWSSNVSRLYLSGNSFSGQIPPGIGEKMPMLSELDLSNNSLTGSLPASMGDLYGLQNLYLSDNNFSGEIPEFSDGVPNLIVHIDLSNNNLSGELPASMGSMIFLTILTLSNNHFSGELPSTLQNCTYIRNLDLGGNRFSGKIPAWIGETMTSLWILRLRSNLFSGRIPSELCALSSLHILDLAENNLTGNVPYCTGNLSAMSSEIGLYRYEGESTVSTKGREDSYKGNLYLVNVIDLSNNGLSGDVPGGLTNLSFLGTLNLSGNHLTGRIPETIGRLQRLETLDLSRNQLSGSIPAGMASLTFLSHLNLSYNNLSGRIPMGNQLQALDDPSIYRDNPALCGRPTRTACPGDDDHATLINHPEGDGDEDEDEDGGGSQMKWFYVSMGTGFVVGFWGVCGTLAVKQSWRHAYFRGVYEIKEWLILHVQLNAARLRRKLNFARAGTCMHAKHAIEP